MPHGNVGQGVLLPLLAALPPGLVFPRLLLLGGVLPLLSLQCAKVERFGEETGDYDPPPTVSRICDIGVEWRTIAVKILNRHHAFCLVESDLTLNMQWVSFKHLHKRSVLF